MFVLLQYVSAATGRMKLNSIERRERPHVEVEDMTRRTGHPSSFIQRD